MSDQPAEQRAATDVTSASGQSSAERDARRASLESQLRAFLADQRALDTLVPAATEPAFTPLACFAEADNAD